MRQRIALLTIFLAVATAWWAIGQRAPPSLALPNSIETLNLDTVKNQLLQAQTEIVEPEILESISEPARNDVVPADPPEWAIMRQYSTDQYRLQLIQESLPDVDFASLPALKSQADQGDGEAAYLIYLRYAVCLGAARTEQDLSETVAFWLDQAAEDTNFDPNPFIDSAIQNYEICAEFGRDLKWLRFEWFTRATQLGYLIAQIDYPTHVRSSMLELAIRDPGVIDRYRATALNGLRLALKSGHTQVFNAWAGLYLEGILVDRNPFLAYVWAHTAELSSHGASDFAAHQMRQAESELGVIEVREASAQARDYCDQYCR